MTTKTVRQGQKKQKQGAPKPAPKAAEQPVNDRIDAAAERLGPYDGDFGPGAEMSGTEHDALRELLTCGLYVADHDAGCRFEDAIRWFAISTLKATAIAAANEGGTDDNHSSVYPSHLEFTMHDCARVMAGVANLLEHAPAVLDYARLGFDEETAESEGAS